MAGTSPAMTKWELPRLFAPLTEVESRQSETMAYASTHQRAKVYEQDRRRISTGELSGGKHEYAAAEFPLAGDNGVSDFDTRLDTGGVASGGASFRRGPERSFDTGFLRDLGPSLSDRF